MAITGTLLADFTAFYDAAKKAETSLQGMQTTAGKTEQALDQLTLFDMSPAASNVIPFDRALAGLGATAGTTAPALTTVGSEAATAGGKVLTFQQSFQQVDKTLAAVGVNLGPIPGAITEIGAAAGKTAGQLGALGTAGLVAGAAITGWKIGEKVGEWTGWTDAIGRATSKLLGWGDVAAVEAAEGARTLASASAIAGREITSMDEAIRIIGKSTKDYTKDAAAVAVELEKQEKAAEKAAARVASLFSRDDIARAEEYVTDLGGIENLTLLTKDKTAELHKAVGDALAAYTALGDKAPWVMQRIYTQTTELIPVTQSFSSALSGMWAPFAQGIDDAAAKLDILAAAVTAQEKPWRDLGGVSKAELEALAATAAEKYATALEHSDYFTAKQIADFKRGAEEAKAAADNWGTALEDQYANVAAASTRSADHQIAEAQRVSLSWSEAMDAARRGEGTMGGTVQMSQGPVTPEEMAAMETAFATGRYSGPVTGATTDAFGYRVGGRIDYDAINRLRGVPAAGAGGTGGVSTNVTVNGSVLSNPHEIARVVGDAVMASLRAGGVRLPAGP
jgi:hypothetical protein